MNKVMLKVVDLHTYFFARRGVVKGIDGVSFYVQEGETLGIVGESGSGKTVTSLSVLRLVEKPDGKIVGGKISFDGKDLLELSEEEMRSYRGKIISIILQDPMVLLLLLSLLYFFRRAGASPLGPLPYVFTLSHFP